MKRLFKKLAGEASDSNSKVASEESQISPKLFIHIPKTAGTSFRTAAESRFGTSRILRDYDPQSDATSDSIKKEVYSTGDATGILRAIEQTKATIIAGHVPINKYGGILGLANTVTILRNPVDQVISHYHHAVRNHGFKGDLLTFARQNGVRNLQARMLGNTDPALVGIVGLTESYKSMLAILNCRWGWKLRHQKRNVSNRLNNRRTEVTDREKAEIEKLNSTDLAVYKRASLVFGNSLRSFQQDISSDFRGSITLADSKHGIRGWAFDMYSDEMAQVEILINEKPFRSVNCGNFVPQVACWRLPRYGHVGFAVDDQILKAGDHVAIRTIDNGTLLAETSAVDV